MSAASAAGLLKTKELISTHLTSHFVVKVSDVYELTSLDPVVACWRGGWGGKAGYTVVAEWLNFLSLSPYQR